MAKKSIAVSRMAALGCKFYYLQSDMVSAVEQFSQFDGQYFFDIENSKFWRIGTSRTASIGDYTEVLEFSQLTAAYDAVDFGFGLYADIPRAGTQFGEEGDMWYATDRQLLYVSTGDTWIRAIHGSSGISPWSSQKDYSENDIVSHLGNLYRNVNGTETPDTAPSDEGNHDWVKITNDDHDVPDFTYYSKYLQGQRVKRDGIIYEALIDTSEFPRVNHKDWQVVSDSVNALPRYSAGADYLSGDYISHEGSVYRNKTGNNPGYTPDIDAENWEKAFGKTEFSVWDSEHTYGPGNKVIYNNGDGDKIYITVTTTSESPDTDPDSWEHFSSSLIAVPRYDPANSYQPDDIINYRGTLYKNCYGSIDSENPPRIDTLNWQRVNSYNIPPWTERSYEMGEEVYYNGFYYMANTNINFNSTSRPPDQDIDVWAISGGNGGPRAVAAMWKDSENYQQFDTIFDSETMYWNKTGVNTAVPPNSDTVNWEAIDPRYSGWSPDVHYFTGDRIYINGVVLTKTNDEPTTANPLNDAVNWEIYLGDFSLTISYFDTANEMMSYPWSVVGSMAHVADTNSLWYYSGRNITNHPVLTLFDHEYIAVDNSWSELSVNFPAENYEQHESAKVINADGVIEKYFSHHGLWIRTNINEWDEATQNFVQTETIQPVDERTLRVSKHTTSWIYDPAQEFDKANYGTSVTILGTERELVECKNWDINRSAGDDEYLKRFDGPLKGNTKRPILTVSYDGTEDCDYGVDFNMIKIFGRGDMRTSSPSISTMFYGGNVTQWPGWEDSILQNDSERQSPIETTAAYMSFPGIDGRWFFSCSSAGVEVVVDSESSEYVTVDMSNGHGAPTSYRIRTGSPHRFKYPADGALFYGLMEPFDSDQIVGNGPAWQSIKGHEGTRRNTGYTAGNWYPDSTDINGVFNDPDPWIEFRREDNTEFWFQGLRGQFMQRCNDDDFLTWSADTLDGTVTPALNVKNVWGGWPERVTVQCYDIGGTVIDTFILRLMEDYVRELDPDNDNYSGLFWEGMHYIDINNRLFHAIDNKTPDLSMQIRESIRCHRVRVTFSQWPDNDYGTPFTHRQSWGLNSFCPIVSDITATTYGAGTLNAQQWMKTGSYNAVNFYGEFEYGAGWIKTWESYPYQSSTTVSGVQGEEVAFPVFR